MARAFRSTQTSGRSGRHPHVTVWHITKAILYILVAIALCNLCSAVAVVSASVLLCKRVLALPQLKP